MNAEITLEKAKPNIIPDDYNDIIYRITYHYLSKVAPYIPHSITPNQITYSGFFSAILGCLLLYYIDSPVAYLYWFFCNFIWYILDALDGLHARLSKQTSEYGAFLDHFLDNIFFILMLTVFAVKFDLEHTLYVYAIILRVTGALMVFLVQAHTKRLYLGAATGGLELLLFSIVMILSYLFPDFNLSQHTTNPNLLHLIEMLNLQHGVFMKLALLVYIVGVPINILSQWRFVKQHCESQNN